MIRWSCAAVFLSIYFIQHSAALSAVLPNPTLPYTLIFYDVLFSQGIAEQNRSNM